jgi:hypothetical protein
MCDFEIVFENSCYLFLVHALLFVKGMDILFCILYSCHVLVILLDSLFCFDSLSDLCIIFVGM